MLLTFVSPIEIFMCFTHKVSAVFTTAFKLIKEAIAVIFKIFATNTHMLSYMFCLPEEMSPHPENMSSYRIS